MSYSSAEKVGATIILQDISGGDQMVLEIAEPLPPETTIRGEFCGMVKNDQGDFLRVLTMQLIPMNMIETASIRKIPREIQVKPDHL